MILSQTFLQSAVLCLAILGLAFVALGFWLARKSSNDDDQIASIMYSLTHDELSNPIQSAYAALANIESRDKNSDSNGSSDLQTLRASLAQLNELTRNLRKLVLLEWPRSSRIKENVNIVALVQNLIVELGDVADKSGVRLMYEGGDTQVDVLGTEQDLRRVFTNLIGNGIKFSKNNPQACVLVHVEANKHRVLVEVSDNGPGISATQLSTLGKAMQKPTASTASSRGSGLGLFLVKRIVDTHNGKIEFHSVEAKGTTVTVKLPLKS